MLVLVLYTSLLSLSLVTFRFENPSLEPSIKAKGYREFEPLKERKAEITEQQKQEAQKQLEKGLHEKNTPGINTKLVFRGATSDFPKMQVSHTSANHRFIGFKEIREHPGVAALPKIPQEPREDR